MSSLVRILVPVDFSECSWLALKVAVSLGERLAATVDVVHVWDMPAYRGVTDKVTAIGGPKTHSQWVLDEVGREIQRLLSGLTPEELSWVHTRIEKGKAAPTIVGMSEDYDLLVMGTHGRTGLAHVLMGSVAERVIRGARCPVLTTRRPLEIEGHFVRQEGASIHKLCKKGARFLVAVDFSDCSRLALRRVVGLADELGAQVEVLHVVELPETYVHRGESWIFTKAGTPFGDLRANAAKELDQFVADIGMEHQPVVKTTRLGRVRENILSYAESGAYDLLALGTHGRSGWSHFWLGSIAEQVVRRAPCPVLAVRELKEEAAKKASQEKEHAA